MSKNRINPLHEKLAVLYGLSPTNSKMSFFVTEAKKALGINSFRKLSLNEQTAIYDWHVVKIVSQLEGANQTVPDLGTVPESGTVTDSVKIISQLDASIRFAFYTHHNGIRKRQVIALELFFVEALLLATGLDKSGITAWIQSSMDGLTDVRNKIGLTKQVKCLIVHELMHSLLRATSTPSQNNT